MPFKKGHTHDRGRKKKQNKKRTDRTKSPNTTIDKYFITKEWVKQASKKVDNIEDIEYYIYNDIPLEEYYNNLKSTKDENM